MRPPSEKQHGEQSGVGPDSGRQEEDVGGEGRSGMEVPVTTPQATRYPLLPVGSVAWSSASAWATIAEPPASSRNFGPDVWKGGWTFFCV